MASEPRYMKASRFHAGLLVAALLTGCASTPDEQSGGNSSSTNGLPEWVLEEPQDQRYAFGVGSAPLHGDEASARRVATDRARSALISSMRVTVEGETRTSVERVRENGRSDVSRGFTEQVRASIPETTLDELEVAEVEADNENNTLYVLARLDRVAARNRLSHEIERIKVEIQSYREQETQSMDRVERVRKLRPAAQLISRAEEKQNTLALVSDRALENRPVSEEYSDVLEALWQALDDLRIHLDHSDMPAALSAGLRAGLTDQGLRIGGDDTPDLTLSTPDGRTLAQFNQNKRASSTDSQRAEDRVIQDLADSLSLTIGEQLFNAL